MPEAATLTISFERDGARGDELSAVELELLEAVVYVDRAPDQPRPRAPCDAQGGVRVGLAAGVVVDLTSGGRTRVGTVSLWREEDVRPLHEIRLLVRAPTVRSPRDRFMAAGRLTCLDGGAERAVLRLVAERPIPLERDADHPLVAEFHTRGDLAREGSRLLVGQHYPLTLER